MVVKLIRNILGTRNERVIKSLSKTVSKINQLEQEMQGLSDEALRLKTDEFKERFSKGETLDDLLPEAFAVVRESSVRTLGQRHFDVQLIGGMVLHSGKISEMRTGEGKTLVATLSAYLNAITGGGVHIVTVNDYLAKRDAEWMGPIYNLLGFSVGVIVSGQSSEEKKEAYSKDIVYGTNNEFGFDYLRDNMAFSAEEKVQRSLYYAIVDEVDSILIDEARTPLIISGPSEESSDLYVRINKLIPHLKKQAEKEGPGDYFLDEKFKQAYLTEEGHRSVEKLFLDHGILRGGDSLYDVANIKMMHYLNASLRANTLFHRDVDYIVRDNEVVIVDEHTGRTMDGRRWSDGLHQAVEAKEGVDVHSENQTLASITFQNYFRLYKKLSGMTGTADTEAYEFHQIYGLEVVVIPTNQPMIRKDFEDQIYLTAQEKYRAIIDDIKECVSAGRPVLVGTISIENSELLSSLLAKENIPHQVLNAKQHEREAKIIADAGRPYAVTIATNMAGRGTDIVLGGNLKAQLAEFSEPTLETVQQVKEEWSKQHDLVVASSGLHIIGSERHESRRIDNQLRGRAGRQGDPGSSRFYLSLEDNLLRIFASDRVALMMKRLGMQENQAIEHKLITQSVERAQRKVEGHNFDIRKELLEYDNVANEQRKVIYSQRDDLMASGDILDTINVVRDDVINKIIDIYIPPNSFDEQWDLNGIINVFGKDLLINIPITEWLEEDASLHESSLRERILQASTIAYENKERQIGSEIMRRLEKSIMLQSLDINWKDHLAAMDHLREGIHLRGYAQQNPKQEYKKESFKMFTDVLENVKQSTIKTLYAIEVRNSSDVSHAEEERRHEHEVESKKLQYVHNEAKSVLQNEPGNPEGEAEDAAGNLEPFIRDEPKIGRNSPCTCGSGKKYKQCCGMLK